MAVIGPAKGACDANLISQSLTHPTGCQAPCWALGDSLSTEADKVLSSESSEREGKGESLADNKYGNKQNRPGL